MFTAAPVRGRWRRLETPLDVLELLDGDPSDVIAVVRDAGATFLGPVFGDLAGVVCTGGTPRSHIGIVSREFGVPAIMGAVVEAEPADAALVELDCSGDEGIVRD